MKVSSASRSSLCDLINVSNLSIRCVKLDYFSQHPLMLFYHILFSFVML